MQSAAPEPFSLLLGRGRRPVFVASSLVEKRRDMPSRTLPPLQRAQHGVFSGR